MAAAAVDAPAAAATKVSTPVGRHLSTRESITRESVTPETDTSLLSQPGSATGGTRPRVARVIPTIPIGVHAAADVTAARPCRSQVQSGGASAGATTMPGDKASNTTTAVRGLLGRPVPGVGMNVYFEHAMWSLNRRLIELLATLSADDLRGWLAQMVTQLAPDALADLLQEIAGSMPDAAAAGEIESNTCRRCYSHC